MNRKVTNSVLVVIFAIIIVVALVIRSNNSSKVVLSENPLTQGTEVSGGGSTYDKEIVKETGYAPTLLSNPKIFELGMRSSEYHALIRSLDTYTKEKYGQKTHVVYTIDSATIAFDEKSNTFTFRLEEGKNSGKFLDVTVKRPEFNYLDLTMEKNGKTVHQDTIMINTRL